MDSARKMCEKCVKNVWKIKIKIKNRIKDSQNYYAKKILNQFLFHEKRKNTFSATKSTFLNIIKIKSKNKLWIIRSSGRRNK